MSGNGLSGRSPLTAYRSPAAWLIVLAACSVIVAPQLGALRSQGAYVPVAAAVALNLLFAVALGLAWARTLAGASVRPSTAVALAHLPLLALWLPALRGASSSSFRLFLPLAVGASATLAAVLLWRRLAALGWLHLTKLLAAVAVPLAASAVVVATRPEGRVLLPVGLAWGLYLLVALVGWGSLVARRLLGDSEHDWGLRAALGLAVAVAVGGLLNLVWAISPAVLLLFLAVGAAVWWRTIPWQRLRAALKTWSASSLPERLAPAVLAALVVGLALVQLVGSLAGTVDTMVEAPAFDLHDDCQAYLVFPQKMLQLGSLGPEPFEARRMLSLGGQSFLQALVVVALPVRGLHLLEEGLALLIVLGLVLGGARRRRLGRVGTLLALLTVVALPHLAMRGNTSSVLTGLVLLLAWYRLEAERTTWVGGVGAAALLGSSVVALKSTFLPAALAVVGLGALLEAARDRRLRPALRGAVVTCGLALLLLAPWMLSVYESSHTLFYPLLGHGFDGASFTNGFEAIHGDFQPDLADYLEAAVRQLLRLLPVFLLLLVARNREEAPVAATFAIAAALAAVAVVIAGDPFLTRSLSRYAFPMGAAALLGAMLAALRPPEEGQEGALGGTSVLGALVAVGLLISGLPAVEDTYEQVLTNVGAAVEAEPAVPEEERRAEAALLDAVPPGETVLATVPHPFLLDLSGHRVDVMSLPGMASLPPGLPVYGGAAAVADYLGQHRIRYLAYGGLGSLRDLLTLSEAQIVANYPRSKMRWAMLRYHQRYRTVVEELASSRKRLYSDDAAVVLDLQHPVLTVVPAEREQALEGFSDGVWTNGNGVIRGVGCNRCGTHLLLSTMGWHPYGDQAEKLRLEVLADGRPLVYLRPVAPAAHLFRIPSDLDRFDTLTIRSDVIDPALVGVRAEGVRFGLDVRAVEIGDASIAEQPIRTAERRFLGVLLPERVPGRSGFYADNNWTNGEGVLSGLHWVPAGHPRYLVVSLHPVHPFGNDLARLAVRAIVDDTELELERFEGRDLYFRLPEGVTMIDRVVIRSVTFVPSELGNGDDDRRLGIPVSSLRLE